MKLYSAFLLFLVTLPGMAQQTASALTQPTVRFSFDWTQGVPWQKYSFVVQPDGKTHFEGIPHPEDANSNTDPVVEDFTLSALNRQTIFDLAQKLNYFRGNLDSHIKHIAQTGTKTLEYQSPQIQGSASYNYSQNPDVQHLTRLFAAIATTIDYGQKLTFQYRFDKLGMEQRLKELEEARTNHDAAEFSLIAPLLHKIADDPNLMNIARESARRLLQSMLPQ